MDKKTIFENAIRELKKKFNLPITIAYENPAELEIGGQIVKIELNGFELIYIVEIKMNVNRALIGQIKLENKNVKYPYLVVTDYAAKEAAGRFKEMGVQFIDAAGNAYLNQFPLYIFEAGNKPDKKYRGLKVKRIYKPTGLKILYDLLINPDLINMTYREIAEAAGVALGTVAWVMKDLRELGVIVEPENRKRILIDDKKMLMEWCINYAAKLKPAIHLGNYEFLNKGTRWTDLKVNNALWGGEPAAAQLTQYLTPEILTLYVAREDMNKVITENRLTKTEKGKIRFYEKFWIGAGKNDINTVDPILVYADLLETGDDRNIETANIIYEQYLKHFG